MKINPTISATHPASAVGQSHQTELRGKPKTERIGRKTYDALMALLTEEQESPTSPLGVFVANSTKRDLKRKMESIILP